MRDTAAASAGAAGALPDLKTLIHEHSLFFDKLVELIPAKFFLASSDDKPWYPGLSKAEKQTLKNQTRENIKKSRRARLDPTQPVSSTLDLIRKSIDQENENSDSDEEEEEEEESEEESEEEMEDKNNKVVVMDEKPVTYEELQERLRKRIAEMSSGRNTRPEARWKHEKRIEQKSKKKVKSHPKKNKDKEEAGPSKRKRDDEKDETFSKSKKKKSGGNSNKLAEPTDITFGQVNIDSKKKRKKRLPKEKELERAKKLEEAKKDPEKGKKVSWKSAVSKAAGEKVHDDPRLLNKSIKRDKKKQKKNAQKWKEREETVGKARQEKQKSRMDNIKERIHNKKARKVEKREKKLMRPGFEGRKEGHIN